MEDDWEIFLKLLKDVSIGKGTGIFASDSKSENTDPKTWEEMLERLQELPGDEPSTWHTETRTNLNDQQNNH